MSEDDVLRRAERVSTVEPVFEVKLAQTVDDHRQGQSLRYAVFVQELGAATSDENHAVAREQDRFDDHADQLLLFDRSRRDGDQVVGVYRLMDDRGAQAAGGFYSAREYDLSILLSSGRPLLELGRSCLHADYRGGAAMWHLWQGLAQLVNARGAEVLFGVASFAGTDPDALAGPLSWLARSHLAPTELRPRSLSYTEMDRNDTLNKAEALRQVPALIKAYLRLGGVVGDGAYIDHAFNTTDICLVLDLARMNPRQKALYAGGRAG